MTNFRSITVFLRGKLYVYPQTYEHALKMMPVGCKRNHWQVADAAFSFVEIPDSRSTFLLVFSS